MIKKTLSIFLSLVIFVLFTKTSWAAYLSLTRIGTLSTVGTIETSYSYAGALPDLSGVATPGATVAITVNAVTATTSAAVSGIWIFRPTNIVGGTNTVSIASGVESLSFLLQYTPTPTATPTATVPEASSGALPETGVFGWPLFLVGIGVTIFIIGSKYKEKISEEWNI